MYKIILLAAIMVFVSAVLTGIDILHPEQFGEVICFSSCLIGAAHMVK